MINLTARRAPIRVKITMETGEVWFATAPPLKMTSAQMIIHLNKCAKKVGAGATYGPATEEEYQAYRNSIK